MIIDFSFGNYKSFKDIQTLSMQAAKIKSKYPEVDKQNVFQSEIGISLLKSKAIFGANASGKSNVAEALLVFLKIIQRSINDEEILNKSIEPFLLNIHSYKEPVFFQMNFILDQTHYRYGFEAFRDRIANEWLFGTPNKKEVYFFIREGMEIKINEKRFKEGNELDSIDRSELSLLRENSLFLGVVAALGGKLSRKISRFFNKKIGVISGIYHPFLNVAFTNFETFESRMTDLLKSIDSGIVGLKKIEIDSKQSSKMVQYQEEDEKNGYLEVQKKVYDEEGQVVDIIGMEMSRSEAEGTKKLIGLAPFIFNVLDNSEGGILVIDEFDARLHPRLSQKIVALFNSELTNPNNAQLIFITHDSNFLDSKLLRRDQIVFVEKDKKGVSSIHSLVEFKGIRNDASFEKDYLKGKYGAVPTLNQLDQLFMNPQS